MRHLIALTITSAIAVTSSVALAAAPVSPSVQFGTPVFVLTGGGWGHGVGMSQYGAYGQARAGRTYRDILGFYYPGTAFEKAAVREVRVLLAARAKRLRISSPVPFEVKDATGASYDLPAGERALGPKLLVELDEAEKATPLAGPLVFVPGKGAPLSLDGKPYRGSLHVAATPQKRLEVINHVGLEAYLLGVVPGEVPKQWPLEALKAQTVAARSYTLASLVKGKPFDLYSDVRSQMYIGIAGESPGTSRAVQATRGEVLTYGGNVALTFYFSTSGGRTASAADVFGVDYPYLKSVEDPWDTISPVHRWEPRTFTGVQLQKGLGLSSPVVDVRVVPNASGRVSVASFTTKVGQVVDFDALDVRTRLGLRSTAFRLGVLRLARPATPVIAGKTLVLSGIIRDVDDAVLEKLGPEGAWLLAAKPILRSDGMFTITLRPTTTVTYRLSAGGLPGPALTVTVGSGETS